MPRFQLVLRSAGHDETVMLFDSGPGGGAVYHGVELEWGATITVEGHEWQITELDNVSGMPRFVATASRTRRKRSEAGA